MSKEERHLQTKIRIFEDMLIRCKDYGQIELTKMRLKLQKMRFERMES